MNFRVHITAKAEADIESILGWFQTQSASEAGQRWFVTIWKAIDTLETRPERCSLASEFFGLDLDIRQLLFGRQRGRYRILFQIQGKTVQILRIW